MVYMTQQRGAYYFQMRVPRKHRGEYGELIRVALRTSDREVARVLATGLAAQWLARFSGLSIPVVPGGSAFSLVQEAALVSGTPLVSVPQGAGAIPPAGPMPPLGGEYPAVPVPEDQTFLALFEYWCKLNPNRPLRTVVEFRATADAFDTFAKLPAARVSRRNVAAYRDSLLASSLHPKTVTKKLGHLSAIMQAAVDAGLQENNPFRGLRVPRQEGQSVGRRPFNAQELGAVFASPVYGKGLRPRGAGGDACAWLPALGLLTGCRLEELCQLRVRDVEADAVHGLLIHIRPDGLTARVKNNASIRVVPVHAELLRIGFGRYVDGLRTAGGEWLFPALTVDRFGKRSGNWSKWWGRYLRHAQGCGIADRTLVFHAFRHTFKTLCRAARIPEDVHDALTGHSIGQVGRLYGNMPVDVLVKAMATIELPVRLPLINKD